MDLSKILSISGKPGLFKMLTQTKNGLVVESFIDGKKSTAFSHERISTLEEISIYTKDEDMPLKEVFRAIYDMQKGEEAIAHKSDNNALKTFFADAVPDYDSDNVYVSDIKKVIYWYNTLHKNNLLDFTEEAKADDVKEESESAEKPAADSEEK